ncbi:hypothetical protein ACJMK2_038773 [Sinanodonta woodiana]|uniref:B box-type domain-containing protein n=1 Tax=Sinanodonta woodiana TaxID=1069815 RepID=A0ABD3WA06_SINWO
MSGNISAEINAALEIQCSIHQGEAILYFCKSHDALCCLKCNLNDHKDWCNIVDIDEYKQETLDRNSRHLLDELKHIEEHLLTYIGRNQSNLDRLQQEVQNVLKSINEAKDNVLKLITQFERDVERQVNLIFDEEDTKKSEEIHHCQALLADVQASTQRLDSVILNGNKTQNFVAEYQEQKRMIILRDQVFSKYGKIQYRNVKITMCGDLASLLSLPESNLGIVKTEQKTEPLTRTRRSLDDGGSVKISRCFDIWHILYSSDYTGAAVLSTGYVILIDKNMRMCCLFDSQYRHISHYRFSTDPGDICVFNDEEIAVSLPNVKKIQLLKCTVRVRNGKLQFTQSSSINPKYYCDGLAVLAKDKVVISGYNDTGNKNYFWGIWTKSGKEEHYQDLNQKGGKGTYLATNKSKTCILMSCFDINTVYCFGLDGHLYFKYNSTGLVGPMGIGVDNDGSIYVVGRASQNIHQLTQDGTLKETLSSGILIAPQKIAFSVDGLTSLITNKGEGNKCCIFHLK